MSMDSPAPSDPKAAKRAAEREERARVTEANKAKRASARDDQAGAAERTINFRVRSERGPSRTAPESLEPATGEMPLEARVPVADEAPPVQKTTEEPGGLSWREGRRIRRIDHDAEKITLERLNETCAQLEQGLQARFSAATAEAVQAIEGQLKSANTEFADLSGKARETVEELREQVSETGKQRVGLEESGAEIKAQTAAAQDTVRAAIENAIAELSTRADERVKRMNEDFQEVTDLVGGLREEFSARVDGAMQRVEQSSAELDGRAADLRRSNEELREQISEAGKQQRVSVAESGAEIKAQTAAAQDTVRAVIENAIAQLTMQADERVKRMNEGVQEATDLAEGLREEFSARVDGAMQRVEQSSAELDGRAADLRRTAEELRGQISETGKQQRAGLEESGAKIKAEATDLAEGLREEFSARVDGAMQRVEQSSAELDGRAADLRRSNEELREQISEAGKQQRVSVAESGAEINAQAAAAQDTVRATIENAIAELTTRADERVKRMNESVQGAAELGEGLREEFSARVDGAMQQVDQRSADLDDRAADLQRTAEELREQISETGKQRVDLSGAEISAQAAAAQDTVRATVEKAIAELTMQADERLKRMNESVQGAAELGEGLRKELSDRVDGAMQRVDQSAAEFNGRAADLRRTAEGLRGRMQSAGERAASLEQEIRERSESAAAALKAEGDRQTEILDARIVALEEQRTELQQQADVIQNETGAAREQAAELEEMVKTAATELATFVGASQRELDRTLEASNELVASAAADREQEHEKWEQLRIQTEEELDRTASEIREFFRVELARVRTRVDAIAEASGVAAPLVPEPDSSLEGWVPSESISDRQGDVDLNSAGVSELRALDLTMTQARRLIEHRKRVGRFTSTDQIDEVPGLTADQRAEVKRRATVN